MILTSFEVKTARRSFWHGCDSFDFVNWSCIIEMKVKDLARALPGA